ncbi:olfactory receptor 52A1-like [Hyperolius riggenbachi]|uniref:olfactory receptor 52A1-like n=1 Tax=Hyperolius riggenbachi TaxID=752182 RepID=UPI0035A32BA0
MLEMLAQEKISRLEDPSNTTFYPSFFILTGIPGTETTYKWISVVLCSCYIISLLGNMLLLAVISVSSALHKPMFIFLSLLSSNDALLSTSVTPKLLCILWFNNNHISFEACLLQMFFIHNFTAMESGLLLSMAFDRFIAICQPLRYGSIMTNNVIIQLPTVLMVRNVALVASVVILVRKFPAFKTNVVVNAYCEHMAIAKLAAADIRVNSALGLTVAFTILGIDLLFILVSYLAIFHAVFSLPSKDARLKTFNTCIPHICVFLTFHGLALFTFLTHRYGKGIPSSVHTISGYMYLLLPPVLNPLVYGMKTRLIRVQVREVFCTYQKTFRN